MRYADFAEENRQLKHHMLMFYITDVILNAFYAYRLQQPEYLRSRNGVFDYYFIIASGALVVLDIFLVVLALRKHEDYRRTIILLWLFTAIQGLSFAVEIVYSFIYGDWVNGRLIYLLVEILEITIVHYRLCRLRSGHKKAIEAIAAMGGKSDG